MVWKIGYIWAAMAEWLRRQTWNLLGFSRTGSNPVRSESFLVFIWNLLLKEINLITDILRFSIYPSCIRINIYYLNSTIFRIFAWQFKIYQKYDHYFHGMGIRQINTTLSVKVPSKINCKKRPGLSFYRCHYFKDTALIIFNSIINHLQVKFLVIFFSKKSIRYRKKIAANRIWTCAGNPIWFRVRRLNHSAIAARNHIFSKA